MKFDTSKGAMPPTNLASVQEHLKGGTAHIAYQGLLCLLADAMDRAATGKDTYVVLGLTTERDAMLCTVKEGAAKARSGGKSLLEVSTDAERLL